MEERNDVVLKENNTPALLGFIFSLTVCLYFPGLILSIIGLVTAKNYKNDRKGLAIAGIVISGLLLLVSIGLYGSGTLKTIGSRQDPASSYNSSNNITPKTKTTKDNNSKPALARMSTFTLYFFIL